MAPQTDRPPVDPRTYLKMAVAAMVEQAKGEGFELMKGLSPDHPPNDLFIRAGYAQGIQAAADLMTTKITEAFRAEDDRDEGDVR